MQVLCAAGPVADTGGMEQIIPSRGWPTLVANRIGANCRAKSLSLTDLELLHDVPSFLGGMTVRWPA